VKVVLIHAGLGGGSSYDTTGVGPENDAAALASVTPKPDVVIVGHSHREIRDTVINGVHFVQPKNWAQSLSVVHVFVVQGKVVSVRADLIPLRATPELPRFARRLDCRAPGRAALGGHADRKRRGRVSTPATPASRMGALLDFINEVQRRKAGAQLSAAAAFEVQAGLPNGKCTCATWRGFTPTKTRCVRFAFRASSCASFSSSRPDISRPTSLAFTHHQRQCPRLSTSTW